MALTIECLHCEKALSVPDEAVGKMVRCPVCQSTFLIAQTGIQPGSPVGGSVPSPVPAASPPILDKGSPSTPRKRGQETTKERKKKRHGDENQKESERKNKTQQHDRNPFALEDAVGSNRPLDRPHRGGLILALGILSFLGGCFILAFITISMANVDLIQMAAKRMDASGKTMTRVGKYLAIANLTLTVFLFGLGSCAGLAFFVWR